MKMIIVICPRERQEDIRSVFASHNVHAYTEVEDVSGEGSTGKRLGTHAWPGRSILVFSVVSEEQTQALMAALRECRKNLFPAEGMRAFVVPVEEAL